MLSISRTAVVVLGIVSLGVALYFQRIYDIMVGSWSVLLVSLFVPLLAGIYWSRSNGSAAVVAIVAGITSWLLLLAIQDDWPADLLAFGIAAIAFVAVAWLTRRRDPPRALLDIDGEPIAESSRLGL